MKTHGASPCVPGVVPAARGRGLSLGCSRVFLSRHLFFPNVPFPARLLFCSPLTRNSQVNFINVGVEQMLKATQDFGVFFVLNFLVPIPSLPSHA